MYPLPVSSNNPFRSFWMGGFECTDQQNIYGNRVDLINTTAHLKLIYEDYKRLLQFNILTVREGIRWSKVELTPWQYDFSTVKTMMEAGRACGIQQVWDICHFGYPDDLTPLHPHFCTRFEAVCRAFAQFQLKEFPDEVLIVTPINEVSFISWLGGEVRGTAPYCQGHGWPVKYELIKAYIKGIKAIKEVNSQALILTTEPLVNIVPPLFAGKEEVEEAARVNEEQYQALDMLSGHICPELGGSPHLLDMLGFNFYYNNQWVTGFCNFLPWLNEEPDERWKPLRQLLTNAYSRYNKPVILTETSHPGEDRHKWIKFIGEECAAVCASGIPFWGVCLYPVIDRPDWDDLDNWHHSGLWDCNPEISAATRVLNIPYAVALTEAQKTVEEAVSDIYNGILFTNKETPYLK